MAITKSRRVEIRTDPDTDDLISEAASLLHVAKSAFVVNAARDAAARTVARADVTLMAPELFDAMMRSLDVADESAGLAKLAKLPRMISR